MLFITPSPVNRIEFKIFSELNDAAKLRKKFKDINLLPAYSKLLRTIEKFIKTKILIIHSPLFLVLPYILLAKIFGIKTIAFIWDIYPAIINNKRYDKRITRLIADIIENLALILCDKKIVPSKDFLIYPKLKDAEVIKFWPKFSNNFKNKKNLVPNSELKIIFSGQINETRDLSAAIDYLKSISDGPIRFLIASSDALPVDLQDKNYIEYIGFVDQNELINHVQTCDFGLISLSKNLENPGFPSKTFEYVNAGCPCLYYGPRLLDFISMIETAGVGVDVDSLSKISIELSLKMSMNFEEKRKLFLQNTILDNDSLNYFLEICDCLLNKTN